MTGSEEVGHAIGSPVTVVPTLFVPFNSPFADLSSVSVKPFVQLNVKEPAPPDHMAPLGLADPIVKTTAWLARTSTAPPSNHE
jgi:hypothetical protein